MGARPLDRIDLNGQQHIVYPVVIPAEAGISAAGDPSFRWGDGRMKRGFAR